MGRGGFNGGGTVVGGRGRESGYSTYDPAEGGRRYPGKPGRRKKLDRKKSYACDRVIIDHFIKQKLNGVEEFQFPKKTDPKLKKLIRKRFKNPYEWVEAHHLFNDMYQIQINRWERNQKGETESKPKISDETKLKNNIALLQKKRAELSGKIEEIDQKILLLKSILENK